MKLRIIRLVALVFIWAFNSLYYSPFDAISIPKLWLKQEVTLYEGKTLKL